MHLIKNYIKIQWKFQYLFCFFRFFKRFLNEKKAVSFLFRKETAQNFYKPINFNASLAAICSASFLLRPVPVPIQLLLSRTATVNILR